MGGVGKAFGKLLLFGEHAAVYGYPAVGMSLPEGITVTLGDTVLPDWNLDTVAESDRTGVRGILSRMKETVSGFAGRGGCDVNIESHLARNAGFGSSAALCGAFARAALDHVGRPEHANTPAHDVTRAWAIAHDAERLFHGTPSGVDTGLALLGGTCVLTPRPPGLPDYGRVTPRGLCLVVGAVPRDAACAALIAGLGARLKSGDAAARNSIDVLGSISAEAAAVLAAEGEGCTMRLGALADKAMEQLRLLGLSTPELDRVLATARAAGSIGGKLSGAGGGGAFYAIARDQEAAADIAGRMKKAAAETGVVFTSPLRVLFA
jgi:mevalonate kinase